MALERPSLIVLDPMAREMDGFEFADRVHLHADLGSIPIVVLTAKEFSPEERQRLSRSVETIIHKTSDSRQVLLDQVSDLVANSAQRRGPDA